MKNVKKIVAVLLVAVMLFALVGCDKYPAISKALEKEGYELRDNSVVGAVWNTALEEFYKNQGEEEVKAVVYVWSKGGKLLTSDQGIIIEFRNQKELQEFYEEQSNTIQGAVQDFMESDICNGNCIIITTSSEMVNIFKNA